MPAFCVGMLRGLALMQVATEPSARVVRRHSGRREREVAASSGSLGLPLPATEQSSALLAAPVQQPAQQLQLSSHAAMASL